MNEKKRAYDKQYDKENALLITVRFDKRNDAEILRNLSSLSILSGCSRNSIIKQAIATYVDRELELLDMDNCDYII